MTRVLLALAAVAAGAAWEAGHRVTDLHPPPPSKEPFAVPTDDLFVRYMKAFEASTQHLGECPACQKGVNCPEGSPIHDRFARLQDAYNERQNNRG